MNLKQVLILQKKLHRLGFVERRVGSWVMGWTVVMGAAFIAKIVAPQYVGWEVVGALAGVHELMLVSLYLVNGRRHSMAERLATAEVRANTDS